MPKSDGTLKAREFVFACEELAMHALPGGFPVPERRVMWTILQLFYGEHWAHFELQPHVGRGIVELGLHFEGPAEANEAAAAVLAADAPRLLGELGPGWELEEWTASWRRLHRTFDIERLTGTFAREVGGQLGHAIVTLQPAVAEILGTIRWTPPPAGPPSRTARPRKWGSKARA